MIKFDSINNTFYLATKNTSYILGVRNDKELMHLYWGKRLNKNLNPEVLEKTNIYHIYEPPFEYGTYGSPDKRMPAFEAIHQDGSRITKLLFADYELTEGKPRLEGLPATYCENKDNVQTLTIRLHDDLKDIDVYLSYSVFEDLDAITRSTKIVNNGEKFYLESALSATIDFYGMPESDLIQLDGTWARERSVSRKRITCGNQNVESRYGCSSALHNPFFAVCDKDSTENHGNVYGFSLVYSGNFTAGIEVNQFNSGRAYIGINPFNFRYVLEKGESFQTPEAVLVYSSEGLGGMSRIYHKLYRTRLCRGKFRDADRYVLINNWEATYFNFNEDKIIDIAKRAAEIGIDTLVLDDGWFGIRNTDNCSLGDWYENREKLPNGLEGLAKKVNDLGLRFGLWFEPEMVSPKSDLYEKHPDWALHVEGRESSLQRNQLTLDLSRDDVCEYIIHSVCSILERVNIEYVKWDMNRQMTEAGSALLPAERQGEVMHRYMLGLYKVMDEITSRFPNVLFESCASGGGRYDPGMLYYMPQIWVSDDTDAVERLSIQYGTSIVYPYSTMGAHVSAVPNHQVRRSTPFEMRCNVAMPGQFGFELNLAPRTEQELKIAKEAINEYRRLQGVFHMGDCYRLKSPFECNYSALEFISEDKQTVILCIDSVKAVPNAPNEYVRLEALDSDAEYQLEENRQIYGGDYLMFCGYLFKNNVEHQSKRLIFHKTSNCI